jgi:hypothetical protein
MSCALTQAYALDCSDSVGGIKNIYICAWGDVATYTAASGTVTTLALNTGKTLYKYELEKETGEFTETESRNLQNGTTYYEPVVKFTVRRLQASLRNELNQMAKLRLVAVILDRNGNYWIAGLANGLEKMNSKAQTGKAFGDYNGYDIELHGKEEQPMYSVSPTVLSSLVTPGL